MSRIASLALFLLLVVGGGSLIGVFNVPGEWYAQLVKPSFNPPNWVFAPVWTLLYVMIAVAGWRTWHGARADGRMSVWWTQLFLNFCWSPIFFTLHQVGLALIVLALLFCAILAFIALSMPRDRVAALLFVPYAAWVAFAGLLNASIWILNR